MPARLPRSYLLVPAANPAMIAKAARSAADAVCIDLEDAVAPDQKEASRAHVVQALRELDWGPRLRLYRINGLDTPFAYRDLIEVVEAAGDRLDLIIVPKVNRPEDVAFVDTLLTQIELRQGFSQRIGIEAQIETALGCVNAAAIAASSSRLDALIFGMGDYAASVRMPLDSIGEPDDNDRRYPGHRWHYVMSQLVNAARAYDKRAIDGPFAGLRDPEGFRATCETARALGFDGKWCIHPSQLAATNELFAPPAAQVAWARTVLDEYMRATAEGRGALAVQGKMIDAASLRMARMIVERAEAARARET
ncbi:MAG: HpcH/HpaI aldolase/citrate lyase family protein [Thermomicrobiales bacterium]